jgi:hypothetical protein
MGLAQQDIMLFIKPAYPHIKGISILLTDIFLLYCQTCNMQFLLLTKKTYAMKSIIS